MATANKAQKTAYKKPGFWQRLRVGNLSEPQLAVLLLLPALLTLMLTALFALSGFIMLVSHRYCLTDSPTRVIRKARSSVRGLASSAARHHRKALPATHGKST